MRNTVGCLPKRPMQGLKANSGGGGGNIVIPPVVIGAGETIVAIVPLNTAANTQWQNFGIIQGVVFSPGNLKDTALSFQYSQLGFYFDSAYYDMDDFHVSLNYDEDLFAANVQPSMYATISALGPKGYSTMIGGLPYVVITYNESNVAGFSLLTTMDGSLANDGGALATQWIGLPVANAPSALTPIPSGRFTATFTNNLTILQNMLVEVYSTTDFPTPRGWMDGQGNVALALPPVVGYNLTGAAMQYMNGYFVSFKGSTTNFTYCNALNMQWQTVAVTGIVAGDTLMDLSYDSVNQVYYAPALSGNVYYCNSYDAPMFGVWHLAFSAGLTNSLRCSCSKGSTIAVSGTGGKIWQAVNDGRVAANWSQLNVAGMPSGIRQFNSCLYVANGKANKTPNGNSFTGVWVFAGASSSGTFSIWYSQDLITWYQQFSGAWNGTTVNQIISTAGAKGGWNWFAFCAIGNNILTTGTLDPGQAFVSVAPNVGSANWSWGAYDGTNIFAVDTTNGKTYYQTGTYIGSNVWTPIALPNGFVPLTVEPSSVGTNTTVISGFLSGVPMAAINYVSTATPLNFVIGPLPLFNTRPYYPFIVDRDNRAACVGDISPPTQALPATNVLDYSKTFTYVGTISKNTTFTFTNLPTSGVQVFVTASGAFTATFPGVKWPGGAIPTQTSNGTDIYSFVTDGTNIYGTYLQNFKAGSSMVAKIKRSNRKWVVIGSTLLISAMMGAAYYYRVLL